MLCDLESVALLSCPFVRDTSCRPENYAFDSSAGISNSRGLSPALMRLEIAGLRQLERKVATKELSFDVLSLQRRPLCDQIVACRWIETADVRCVAVNTREVAILIDRHKLCIQILS